MNASVYLAELYKNMQSTCDFKLNKNVLKLQCICKAKSDAHAAKQNDISSKNIAEVITCTISVHKNAIIARLGELVQNRWKDPRDDEKHELYNTRKKPRT